MSKAQTTRPVDAPEPVVVPAHDPARHPEEMVDDVDRGFGHAILTGTIGGVLVVIALCWVVVKAVSDLTWADAGIIALWVGVWSGVFLGGTVAVGRWSMRQGH